MILIYTHMYTHTYLSVYLNLGKECMKQPYLWIDVILGLKIIFQDVTWVVKTTPVSPLAFLLDSHTTSCSHHLCAHTTPCSLYSHTISLLTLLTPPLLTTTSLLTFLSTTLAHFPLTPPPTHTTSLLTPPLLPPDVGVGGFPPTVLCDPSWVSYDTNSSQNTVLHITRDKSDKVTVTNFTRSFYLEGLEKEELECFPFKLRYNTIKWFGILIPAINTFPAEIVLMRPNGRQDVASLGSELEQSS